MSRRSTPERIDEARRAGTQQRLIGPGVIETTAEGWIAAWEAQAGPDGIARGSAYWELAGAGSRQRGAPSSPIAAAVPACAEYSDDGNAMVTTRHRLRVQIHAGGPP
jgi:hypothetical protein